MLFILLLLSLVFPVLLCVLSFGLRKSIKTLSQIGKFRFKLPRLFYKCSSVLHGLINFLSTEGSPTIYIHWELCYVIREELDPKLIFRILQFWEIFPANVMWKFLKVFQEYIKIMEIVENEKKIIHYHSC